MAFPEWYHEMFWGHMILIPMSDTYYHFCPPNQMDWMINVSEVAPDRWLVRGEKQGFFAEEETFESIWVKSPEGFWVKE
jgi:hypothetical protein